MTREELQRVDSFEISNEHGRIFFFGETDLTGVDLSREVTINKNSIEVYEG